MATKHKSAAGPC